MSRVIARLKSMMMLLMMMMIKENLPTNDR